MNRWFASAVAVVILGTVALAVVRPGFRKPAPTHPNVLVVLWDTARADRMSLYGYGKPTTPRLDAFAKEGVVYENAIAPGMWTLNSHAAMFTGLYESTHGARPAYRWLDSHHTTLAELASAAGYDTFAYSSNLIAGPMTNVLQGFETLYTSYPEAGASGPYVKAAKRATLAKLIPEDESTELSPAFHGSDADDWGKATFKDSAPIAHQALVDWLGARPTDRPFFAYLNLMEAHTPRVPSLQARKRVADDRTIDLALHTDASLFASNEYIIGAREYSAEQLGAIGATYDAALVDLDDATGDLLDDLDTRGILDDTLVIVVSDHGEGLGEHRRLEHRWSMYDQLLHVPLVVRYPAELEGVEPGRIAERVNTIDLFATVAEVAGFEVAHPYTRSLARRTTFDRFVFSQMLDPFASQMKNVRKAHPGTDLSPWARTYCVVYEGSRKLIYGSDGRHELYDIATDPGELANLYESELGVRGALEQALTTFEAGLPAYDPTGRTPDDRPKGRTDEERAMMEALGYVANDDGEEGEEGGEGPLGDFCGPRRAGN